MVMQGICFGVFLTVEMCWFFERFLFPTSFISNVNFQKIHEFLIQPKNKARRFKKKPWVQYSVTPADALSILILFFFSFVQLVQVTSIVTFAVTNEQCITSKTSVYFFLSISKHQLDTRQFWMGLILVLQWFSCWSVS